MHRKFIERIHKWFNIAWACIVAIINSSSWSCRNTVNGESVLSEETLRNCCQRDWEFLTISLNGSNHWKVGVLSITAGGLVKDTELRRRNMSSDRNIPGSAERLLKSPSEMVAESEPHWLWHGFWCICTLSEVSQHRHLNEQSLVQNCSHVSYMPQWGHETRDPQEKKRRKKKPCRSNKVLFWEYVCILQYFLESFLASSELLHPQPTTVVFPLYAQSADVT